MAARTLKILAWLGNEKAKLVFVIVIVFFSSKICEKVGMKKEWSMKYSEFVDDAGQRVFFPRDPHHTVTVYIKKFEQGSG